MARALTLIKPARSPERQQLADAILERDRRATLVQAKSAEITRAQEARYALYDRQREAEAEAGRFGGQMREMERRDALLRGETPPAEDEADKARAAVEAVKVALTHSHEAERVLASDLDLLKAAHERSAYDVKTLAEGVVVAEKAGAPDAVVAAYHEAKHRVRMLARAINGALNVSPAGPPGLMYHVDTWTETSLPPCPWDAALNRLVSDPDARLPMPEDVFAEPPPRSAA